MKTPGKVRSYIPEVTPTLAALTWSEQGQYNKHINVVGRTHEASNLDKGLQATNKNIAGEVIFLVKDHTNCSPNNK